MKLTGHIRSFISRHTNQAVLAATAVLSLGAFAWFYLHGHQNLADYDAIARLNIARKIIDSNAPGFGQLGGIWLPFPQVLMVPLIWNDFLWRSGIAGAAVSMSAFIAGTYYLYQTVMLLTKNRVAALIAWGTFVTNFNLLFLQTMAMSESFFFAGIIMTLYALTKWVIDRKLSSLLLAAFAVTIVTLTRYEGYAILLASLIVVVLGAFVFRDKNEQKGKAEGILVIFVTLASLGIFLWTIYSWAIYHDPIYWLHLYSGVKNVVDAPISTALPAETGNALLHNASRAHSLGNSAATYTWAMTLMLGIPVALATLASYISLLITTAKSAAKHRLDTRLMPLVITATILVLFLIFGYWRGLIPQIETPAATWSTLLTQASNLDTHTNIRYGLIMLPIAAILIGYLAARRKVFAWILALVILEQVVLGVTSTYFLQFQLAKAQTYTVPAEVDWFKSEYDGGAVLVSAQRHEPFMLQTGLPYKTFIFEGSRQLWLDSLAGPTTRTRWVVLTPGDNGDAVDAYINHDILDAEYDLVHETSELQIYKLKAKEY